MITSILFYILIFFILLIFFFKKTPKKILLLCSMLLALIFYNVLPYFSFFGFFDKHLFGFISDKRGIGYFFLQFGNYIFYITIIIILALLLYNIFSYRKKN